MPVFPGVAKLASFSPSPDFVLRIPCSARSPARPSLAGRSSLSRLTRVRALGGAQAR
ncbi:MAG: hypothetical protein NUV51_12165 [Sulfuricaulis sp.]|nr:hypothetical protein [Sulfuricaulis sp.]